MAFGFLGIQDAYAKMLVNKDKGGMAIDGFDPVAYFKSGQAVGGNPTHSHTWKGAVWIFRSEENKKTFAEDPERYMPQYGGFCSWAFANGRLSKSDPRAWSIVDGKLYLNCNSRVRELWEKDRDNFIQTADKLWEIFKATGSL